MFLIVKFGNYLNIKIKDELGDVMNLAGIQLPEGYGKLRHSVEGNTSDTLREA